MVDAVTVTVSGKEATDVLSGILSTKKTALAPLLAELDEDVRVSVERYTGEKAERLRSAVQTAAHRVTQSLEGLAVRWPSSFAWEQFETDYLPLLPSLHTALRDMEILEHDWKATGESLDRQANDLALRIANEYPAFMPGAVAELVRYLRLKAEVPLYAQALPGLRDTLARLRDQWLRTKPIASKNCTTYLALKVARQQIALTKVVQEAAASASGRDQFVDVINNTAHAFESRYGVKVPGVTVDRESYTIVPVKAER
jgi:hypothetical protein